MRNSMKQLYRMPAKLLLFFLLTAVSTALLIFGVNLWLETSQKLAETEKSFTTIGTVQQKESSTKVYSQWNATTKAYTNYDDPIYDKNIPVSVLRQKDLNYLKEPEKRPYYGAMMTKYHLTADNSIAMQGSSTFIAEFTPVEDCVPSEPVPVKIVQVLYGDVYGSTGFWFCDEYNDHPKPLKAGQTYIAYIQMIENKRTKMRVGANMEGWPFYSPFSTQYDKDGKQMDSKINTPPIARKK